MRVFAICVLASLPLFAGPLTSISTETLADFSPSDGTAVFLRSTGFPPIFECDRCGVISETYLMSVPIIEPTRIDSVPEPSMAFLVASALFLSFWKRKALYS